HPVQAGHPHVHQDHVRAQPPDLLDRLQPVTRLARHLDVRLGLEDHPKAGSDQGLVVDDQDPDRHQGSAPSGSRACTPKPPPGSGPARSSPPKRATRSRIPISPWPEEAGCCSPLPFPSSRTSRASTRSLYWTRISTRLARACLSTLVVASCRMR